MTKQQYIQYKKFKSVKIFRCVEGVLGRFPNDSHSLGTYIPALSPSGVGVGGILFDPPLFNFNGSVHNIEGDFFFAIAVHSRFVCAALFI
jgi:hypothetical protein